MKKWKSLVLISLMCFVLTGCRPDAIDIYNHPINVSDFKGKWVVIHYWTTWCSLCIQQIPALNILAKYYGDDVIVLGVNPENLDNNTLIGLANAYQVNYLFVKDFPIQKWGGKIGQLPVTFILDRRGKLYKTLRTPQTIDSFKKIMNLPNVNYD